MFTVSKTFRWEAAHRLVKGYPGKCQHIHGHSFVAKVALEGSELDQFDFLADFGDFKALRDWIDAAWDHATLVSNEDKKLLRFLKANDQRHYVVDGNPTSEVLALYLLRMAMELLEPKYISPDGEPRIQVREVMIQETCTSEATVRAPNHTVYWGWTESGRTKCSEPNKCAEHPEYAGKGKPKSKKKGCRCKQVHAQAQRVKLNNDPIF